MKIWTREFEATYIRDDGVVVLNDEDILLPDGFKADPNLRSNVIFPAGARAGDHYHREREEVYVGFGEGMQLIVEDPKTHEVKTFDMDPSKNNGMCVAYYMETGIPHAVINRGNSDGFLVEFASLPQEKVIYKVGEDER